MIDIICYYDNHHERMFDDFFFLTYQKHLSKSFNLVAHKINSKYNNSSFESTNWCELIINRFDILKEYIKNNPSNWVVFSDIDIVFFDNFIVDIYPALYQTNVDILYMSECLHNQNKWYINGGFFLFKCTDYIYNYFSHVQENIKFMAKPNDQIFIQEYLKKNTTFKNDLLNPRIFLTNNQNINESIPLIKTNQTKVFHATSCYKISDKFKILTHVLSSKNTR